MPDPIPSKQVASQPNAEAFAILISTHQQLLLLTSPLISYHVMHNKGRLCDAQPGQTRAAAVAWTVQVFHKETLESN